jgi:D-proline reductase (dithiol) PrdB
MDDRAMRASLAELPVPELGPDSFQPAPPLEHARVALVTTAGVMRPGEIPWDHQDPSFRTFSATEPGLFAGHVSLNLDRTGMVADLEVVFPRDRLGELAADGTIGSVAPHHLSFMGSAYDLNGMMERTGPAAARLLAADGVDAVVTIAAGHSCTRAACILARIFEAHGLASVAVVSNEAQARRAKPARALLSELPTGRTFGDPGDPTFQRNALRRALELLRAPSPPVLAALPTTAGADAPDDPVDCPLPAAAASAQTAANEAAALRATWKRWSADHGTSVGRVVAPEGVPLALDMLGRVGAGASWADAGFTSSEQLFWAVADVRSYYEESALSLLDAIPAARRIEAWFHRNTRAGHLLLAVADQVSAAPQDYAWAMPAAYVVPLSQRPELAGSTPLAGPTQAEATISEVVVAEGRGA